MAHPRSHSGPVAAEQLTEAAMAAPVAADEIGDGYVFGAGWYEVGADSGNSQGAFLVLARPGDDGNLQIQWAVSNGLPVEQ